MLYRVRSQRPSSIIWAFLYESPVHFANLSSFPYTCKAMRDEQFTHGVEQFDQGFYFECHDTLEELWMETVGDDRLFLQGLIQVSVGLFHFYNRNFRGAVSQMEKGSKKLRPYRPRHKGIELNRFLNEVEGWLEQARSAMAGDCAQNHPLVPPRLSTTHE